MTDTGGVDLDKPVNPPPRPVCPRHPERVSYLRCVGCGRPACPDCQHPRANGFECPDCVGSGDHGGSHASVVSGGDGVTEKGAAPRPIVTFVIAGLCTLVYALQRFDPTVTNLGDFSAVAGYVQPWRFLTAAFLHSPDTISHLLFNMMSLYAMGQFLEPFLGRARFVALYLLSALGGSVGYLLLLPALDYSDQASRMAWFGGMVGASGAVFGLFTAVFLVLRRVGSSVGGMVVLLAINLALPFFYPNIAWQAHLGGAVVGLVTAALLFATAAPGRRRWTWPVLAVEAAVLVAAAAIKYGANARELDYILALPIGMA
ncbi:rhomboid family intramembrane serine protease [Mobilicoccus massiliensis]|uniref:rhomboid family intramembrane serine protease n=1 Tax=Mobilicoccus massiliensis TaxID=1522310 RepID=UPI0021C33C77|nr:rhomboid family intramembrane serine protease [Mobilicoccus massiliensis]